MNDVETRFANIPEVEPDIDDITSIKPITQSGDMDTGITLDEMDELRAKFKGDR